MRGRFESAAAGMGLTAVGVDPTIGKGVQLVVPARQAIARRTRLLNHRENLTPINPNMFNNNSIQTKFRVPLGSLTRCHYVSLRVEVKVSNAPVQPLPLPWWFSEFNVKLSTETSLIRQYPETMFFNAIYAMGDSQLKSMLGEMNASYVDDSMFDLAEPLEPGTYTFTMPIIGTWLSQGVWIKDMAGSELVFEFTPARSIMASGLDSNLQCTAMSLIFETEAIDEKDQALISAELFTKNINYSYLDPVRIVEPAKTLTAGQTHEFDLSPLLGKNYAFFLLTILPTGATYANDGIRKWRALGNDGTIDITKSGVSIWSTGAPFNAKQLRNDVFVQYVNNSFGLHKAMYLIPLSQDVRNSMTGSGEAGMLTVNDQFKLRITPGSASIPEINRWTATSLPTSGYFRITYNLSRTKYLPYNASTADIEAAINALPDFASQGFTATVDSKLSDNLVVNVTIRNPSQDEVDDRLLITDAHLLDANGDPVAVDTTVVQRTNGGFADSGGQFDITLFAYQFNSLEMYAGGVRKLER